MRSNLYSIYDSIAEVFNKPFLQPNDASAIRAFTESASEQVHIKDYALYCLGEFNDNNGSIVPQTTPVKIYSGLDIKMGSSITPEMQQEDVAKLSSC